MAAGGSKLLLIDGHSLLNRAFFALPPLTTASGVHTNAVYGLATMLRRLLKDESPDFIAVAFDSGKPTFRSEVFADYKGHRPRMADELRAQVPLAKELVRAHNIPIFELEGFEADDCIGTLARQAEECGYQVVVVTGDKDLLQLVTPGVSALLTRRGVTEMERFGPGEVKQRLGVRPDQIPDLKGLTGDPSDNIPGVPGIGEKTAQRLLEKYDSIEEVLAHAGEVGGKTGRALAEYASRARMSKDLARIDRHAPVEADWETLRRREPDYERLAELYRRLEFRRLLSDLLAEAPAGAGDAPARAPLSPDAPVPGETPSDVLREKPFETIESASRLEEVLGELAAAPLVAVSPAWEGETALGSRPVGIALASERACYYVPVDSAQGEKVPGAVERIVQALSRSGERGKGPLVACHDLKRALLLFASRGEPEALPWDDVMLQGYLCAPGEVGTELDDLARRFGVPPAAPEPKGDPKRLHCDRARVILKLHERLTERLGEEALDSVYRTIELPLVRVLARMERRGIRVDTAHLRSLSGKMQQRLREVEEAIYAKAGEAFNLNSPRQLGRILFDVLKLPVLEKGKTGPSTSAEVLEKLAEEHEIARDILEYRHLQKLKGTYLDALPGLVDPRTGRVHTTFNQAVAATGRLSSAHPNLQNIPVRTPEGQEIRRAFLPEEGWTLLKADYSQIELRILAHMSEDEGLVEAFRQGADIHATTAAEIFGVEPGRVTGAQRSAAKAINFGIVYGISSFGLARGTGLTRAEAQAFIDNYFEKYPGVAGYMSRVVAEARTNGYVTTLWGRRRYLPDLKSRHFARRSFAERAAINTPIQGSAADIIKAAMVAVSRRLDEERRRAHLLLQVHDELLFEVHPEEVEAVAQAVKEEMEKVATLAVPLVAELYTGPNWMDQTPFAVRA